MGVYSPAKNARQTKLIAFDKRSETTIIGADCAALCPGLLRGESCWEWPIILLSTSTPGLGRMVARSTCGRIDFRTSACAGAHIFTTLAAALNLVC